MQEKSKRVREINTQVKYTYLKHLVVQYSNKVFVIHYFPPLDKNMLQTQDILHLNKLYSKDQSTEQLTLHL